MATVNQTERPTMTDRGGLPLRAEITALISDVVMKDKVQLPSFVALQEADRIVPELLVQLDHDLQRHGKNQEASDLYELVNSSDGATTDFLAKLAQNAVNERNEQVAVQRWQTAASRSDAAVEYRVGYIQSLIAVKQVAEAERQILEAPSLASSATGAILLATCYRNDGRLREGLALVNEALRKDQGNVGLANRKASILNELGHFDEAEAFLEDIRQSSPDIIDFAICAAQLAHQARRFDRAESIWRQVRASAPDNVTALLGFINILIERGNIDDAQSTLDQATDRLTARQRWNFQLRILEYRRDEQSGLDYIDRTLSENPIGKMSAAEFEHLSLQKINLMMGRLAVAVRPTADRYAKVWRIMAGILAIRPMNIAIRASLCDLLIAEDRREEAIQEIDLLPENSLAPIAMLKMWRADQLGDHDEAKALWAKHTHATLIPQRAPTAPHHLMRLDENTTTEQPGQITLFTVIRDEIARLPWFLSYYRKLGVSRFVFIDNGSQDGGRDYLAQQSDVYLYWAKETYAQGWDGVRWINELADHHASQGWILYADVDEALVSPKSEDMGLETLTEYMASRGEEALTGLMIDMFSPNSDGSHTEAQGTDFVKDYSYFVNDYHIMKVRNCPYKRQYGGFRQRFGLMENLTKTPLIRGGRGIILRYSSHGISPAVVSEVTCALLHFKFTHGWENRFRADLSTGTRTAWCRARHKAYLRNLTLREGTPSVGQEQVTRYVGSQQLLDLGIINSPQTFIEWEGATK